MIHWLVVFGVAVPCFVMAWHLLRVWHDPSSVDKGRWVQLGVGIFLLEFILAHSGIFLVATLTEPHLGGLGGFFFIVFCYGFMAVAFACAFKSWMLIFDFALITIGRVASIIVFSAEGSGSFIFIRSAISLGLWATLALATVFLPFLFPPLGMTDQNIKESTFKKGRQPDGTETSGLWAEKPHLAIGAGFIYFLILGIVEIAVLGPMVAARRNLDVAQPTRGEAIVAIQKIGGTVKQEGSPPQMTVHFAGTDVTDAQLVHLEWLTELKGLNLAGTSVGDAGLVHLKGLTQLTELRLNSTQVTNAGLANLQQCSRLTKLDLSGLRVTDEGLESLTGLNRLEELRLARTKITDTGLGHLTAIPKLAVLDLSDTLITDTGLKELKRRSTLVTLKLVGTRISDRGLEHLPALTDLRELDLFRTPITDAGLEHLKAMIQLTSLSLNRCTGITDDGMTNLRGLTQLRYLNLGDTVISDAGLVHLEALTDLRILTLARTGVTDAGAKKLQLALPDCVIRTRYY